MIVLGLGFTDHEASAALVIDGRLVTAIARERLTRIKKDGKSWGSGRWDLGIAILYCLDAHGVELRDVDLLVWNHIDHVSDATLLRKLAEEGGMDLSAVPRLSLPHHFAHACSAFYLAPFSDAAVLVADGAGGPLRELQMHCGGPEPADLARGDALVQNRVRDGGEAREEESFYVFDAGGGRTLRKIFGNWHGIGAAYGGVSDLLFGDCLHAGKTMGLASYALPTARPLFLQTVNGDAPVSFEVTDRREREALEAAVRTARQYAGGGFDYTSAGPSTLAASIQAETENALLAHARWLRTRVSSTHLCLAGGVALNCVANSRLARESGFVSVFVPPAPGDDGIAIGCALFGAAQHGRLELHPFPAFLGRAYRHDPHELATLGFDPAPMDGPIHEWIGARLAAGAVVALFQGGAEMGPRALGHRSFLADPRSAAMRDHLNRAVKGRETFRPFAPAVLEETVTEYFDACHPSYFMSFVATVRPKKRTVVPAITHVDGTARYQVVRREHNPDLHDIISAFARRTGVSLVLNTSLNRAGQPIVETPQQAARCAGDAGVAHLVVDGRPYRSRVDQT